MSLERRTQPRSTGLFLTLSALMLLLAMVTQQPWAAGARGEAKALLAPLEAAMTAMADRADGVMEGFGDVAGLRADNQRLRDQNAVLQRELAELQAQGLDNTALRDALGFQRGYGHATVTAQVTAVDHRDSATQDHAALEWVNEPAGLIVVLVITDFVGA